MSFLRHGCARKGGYLYVFDKNDFSHREGLGNLEIIIQKNITPVRIERIDDPVAELKKLGIAFTFTDVSIEESK